jgi:Fanconi anemia group J protein
LIIFSLFLGCSYYAARSMADDAQLVFCPYNYIINPVSRGAMEVDIIGAILVLDEAQYVLQFSVQLLKCYT